MDIFINKPIWDKFTEAQMIEFKRAIYDHYREHGFPFYKLDSAQIKHEYDKLKNFDLDSIINGDVVRQTMHGLALCWYYHPENFSVVCGKFKTAMDAFQDDDLFRKVIDKRIKYGSFMTDAGMRKMLKTMSGVHAVSNFRPSAAAAIYRRYGGGRVWDMSLGYGGRLLGAMASGVVTEYTGTDPNHISLNNNILMFSEVISNYSDNGMSTSFRCEGSENYRPDAQSLDICFTSPPYHATEKYSDEPTQSYIKYPEYDVWLDKFLKKTAENCYRGLKSGGHLIMNIANTKDCPRLEENFCTIADSLNFRHKETLKLQLSRIMGNKSKGIYKYENIFCFTKP